MRILFILSFSGLLFLSYCSNEEDPQPSIVGTWEITSIRAEILIDGGSVKDFYVQYFGFTEEQAQALEDAFDTATFFSETIGSCFKFDEDGTFERTSDDITSSGTYTFDQSQLTIQFGVDKEEIVYQVVSSSPDNLVLLLKQETTADLDSNGIEETISYMLNVGMELVQTN